MTSLTWLVRDHDHRVHRRTVAWDRLGQALCAVLEPDEATQTLALLDHPKALHHAPLAQGAIFLDQPSHTLWNASRADQLFNVPFFPQAGDRYGWQSLIERADEHRRVRRAGLNARPHALRSVPGSLPPDPFERPAVPAHFRFPRFEVNAAALKTMMASVVPHAHVTYDEAFIDGSTAWVTWDVDESLSPYRSLLIATSGFTLASVALTFERVGFDASGWDLFNPEVSIDSGPWVERRLAPPGEDDQDWWDLVQQRWQALDLPFDPLDDAMWAHAILTGTVPDLARL